MQPFETNIGRRVTHRSTSRDRGCCGSCARRLVIHHHDIPKQSLRLTAASIIRITRATIIALGAVDVGCLIRSDVGAPAATSLDNSKGIFIAACLGAKANGLEGIVFLIAKSVTPKAYKERSHILGSLSDPVFTVEQYSMVEAPEAGQASSNSHERANIQAMATLPRTAANPPRLQ